jgi:hypothetical protein
MPQFNVYERDPGVFSDGFDENYAAQIALPANGDGAEDRITTIAEALAWVLGWCWDRKGVIPRPQPITAMRRFVAISMTMRPDLVDMDFTQMARKLRISKAMLSYHSIRFSDEVGLRFRPNRRKSGRNSR